MGYLHCQLLNGALSPQSSFGLVPIDGYESFGFKTDVNPCFCGYHGKPLPPTLVALIDNTADK